MVFSDDSTITLSENTKLEIKEFLFKDQSRRGIFSLAIGKLTADVKKYIGGDNVFEVYSPTVGIGVRGTGFEFVEALQDGKVDSNMATVSCTDGSLNLSAFSDTGAVISTAVLEAGQMAVIIGGIITISMIGVAATAAIGAAGGTGTGTGGAAAAGGAATTTGLSTAAIAGIAIGGAVVVGGVAAAAGGGGGSTTPPTTPCSNTDGRWSGTYSGTECNYSAGGTWVMNCSSCSCPGAVWSSNTTGQHPGNCTMSGNSVSCAFNSMGCYPNNTPCTVNASGTVSGNSVSGTYSGCNGTIAGNWSGSRNGSVTVIW
jgi:hypothetical protein